MNISPVSSYAVSKTSFGYNKQLNKELKKKLENEPDREWSANLDTLNSLCNQSEMNIRNAEKNGVCAKTISRETGLFLRAKEALTAYVTSTYPELNYADREQKSYWNESKKTGSDWLKQVSYVMDTYTNTSNIPKPKPEKTKSEKSTNAFVVQKTENASKSRQTSIAQIQPLDDNLIEEFKPTQFSPKGFKDVAGMERLKSSLQEDVIDPIANPEQALQDFIDYEKEIPRGVLMFGPPGCGKTFITEALAQEADTKMYKLSIGKAGSSYINQTAQNIKKAFEYVGKIGQKSEKPILLFMDEIDSIGFDRSARTDNEDIKQVATLLQSLDDIRDKNVIVIGATNKPNLIDSAVKRRFTNQEYVGLPDKDMRLKLITASLERKEKGKKLLENNDDLNTIVELLDGYSNNSICNISKNASLNAMRRNRADIELEDFKKAIDESEEEKYDENAYKTEKTLSKQKYKIGF